MRKFLMIGAAAAALFATQAAFAETPVGADKQSAIAVTIYNNDLALVRDSRTVTLTQGENDVAFIEVSAGIRPETALLTGRGTPLDIVEQNFDFDLLTPQKLLEKSVGQTIRVVRTNPETGVDTHRGRHRSVGGGRPGGAEDRRPHRGDAAGPPGLQRRSRQPARPPDPGGEARQPAGRRRAGRPLVPDARPLLVGGLCRRAVAGREDPQPQRLGHAHQHERHRLQQCQAAVGGGRSEPVSAPAADADDGR